MKFALLSIACLSLVSCNSLTPAQKAQASALASIAIDYSVRHGQLKPEDAALIREVGTVVLTPPNTPVVPVATGK